MEPIYEEDFATLISTAYYDLLRTFPSELIEDTVVATDTLGKSYDPNGTVGTLIVRKVSTDHAKVWIRYESETKTPHSVVTIDHSNTSYYRWYHPAYREAWYNEDTEVFGGYIDGHGHETQGIEDIIVKVGQLLRGEETDGKVVMVFDLAPETIEALDTIALTREISRDQAIEYILQELIDNFEPNSDESIDA
jgi:hypothetical protein